MESHNWYAVIPAKVLLDENLSDKQKLLIALISNLSNEKGYCFATNKYLSQKLNCAEVTIRQNISFLEEYGLLNRVIKVKNNGQIDYRALTIIDNIPPIKNNHTPDEKQSEVPDEKQSYNNKVYNNKEEYNLFTETSSVKDIEGNGIKKNMPTITSDSSYKLIIEFWLKEFHIGWSFTAESGKKLKSIISKIKTYIKVHNDGNEVSDLDVSSFFKVMCKNLPPYYIDKDLKILDSDFNTIIEKILNGKNGNSFKQQPRSAFAN